MKQRGSRHERRQAHRNQRRATPIGMIAWLCDDPRCVEGIHHLSTPAHEPAPEREEPAAANDGPFSDSSDLTSEGATGAHDTDPC
jgi:hypothetical protein